MRQYFYSFCTLFFMCGLLSAQQPIKECGTPTKQSWIEKRLQSTTAFKKENPQNQVATSIPYRIHLIVKTDSTSAITVQDIYNEIDSVNDFYINSNMMFVECMSPDIIYDDSLFNYDGDTEESILFSNYYDNNIVNIYVSNTASVNGSAVCGYSSYPPSQDYVVVSGTCITNGSTLAHELGHYFGLMHTHGGSNDELVDGSNCATEGDLICDTPADPGLSSSVVSTACVYTGTAVDANSMPYTPDVSNIMSYSRKICRNTFSAEQYTVIENTYLIERNYLMCITAGVNENNKPLVTVFPNPGSNQLYFNFGSKGNFKITLYSADGKLVLSENCQNGKQTIYTTELAEGMYYWKITRENFSAAGKWILQRN